MLFFKKYDKLFLEIETDIYNIIHIEDLNINTENNLNFYSTFYIQNKNDIHYFINAFNINNLNNKKSELCKNCTLFKIDSNNNYNKIIELKNVIVESININSGYVSVYFDFIINNYNEYEDKHNDEYNDEYNKCDKLLDNFKKIYDKIICFKYNDYDT